MHNLQMIDQIILLFTTDHIAQSKFKVFYLSLKLYLKVILLDFSHKLYFLYHRYIYKIHLNHVSR